MRACLSQHSLKYLLDDVRHFGGTEDERIEIGGWPAPGIFTFSKSPTHVGIANGIAIRDLGLREVKRSIGDPGAVAVATGHRGKEMARETVDVQRGRNDALCRDRRVIRQTRAQFRSILPEVGRRRSEPTVFLPGLSCRRHAKIRRDFQIVNDVNDSDLSSGRTCRWG